MRDLTSNILRTFSTQIPSIIISIISGIFLTRLLGAEGKGVYAIFFANIELMLLLFSFGCELGIVYFGSSKKISVQKLQGIAVYLLSTIIPLIAIIILFIDVDFLFPDKHNGLFFKFFLLGVFSLRLINTFLLTFLKVEKSFKYINRINLINSILNLSFFSFLYYLNNNGFISITIVSIFASSLLILMLNTIMWVFSFKKNTTFNPAFNLSYRQDIYPFLIYILPVFISLIINFLNYRFDIWLVSYYKGNIQLGIYVLAVNFAQFILLYSQIIGGVMMPYISEDNEIQRRKYFTTYSRINFTSVILIVTVLAIIGNWLLVFLYGEEFKNSGAPFSILLIGMVFTAMSQLFSIMLFSKGKNNVALLANSVGLISTVVFDVLLIPKYGIMGAAAATSISYFVLFAFLLYSLLVKEKIKLHELFIVKKTDFNLLFQK